MYKCYTTVKNVVKIGKNKLNVINNTCSYYISLMIDQSLKKTEKYCIYILIFSPDYEDERGLNFSRYILKWLLRTVYC